jgi:hypothetical protein
MNSRSWNSRASWAPISISLRTPCLSSPAGMQTNSILIARLRSASSNSRDQSEPPCSRMTSAHTSYPIAASLAPSQRAKALASGFAWDMKRASRLGVLITEFAVTR